MHISLNNWVFKLGRGGLGGDETDFGAGVTVVTIALLSDDSEPGLAESFPCSC